MGKPRSAAADIVCTLAGATHRMRLDWLAELNREGLVAFERNGLVLRLRYRAAVTDRVREMVDMERECCPFLDIAVLPDEGGVWVTISAPARASEVVTAIFEPFVPAGYL